ncbi:MAG TPA: glutamine--fructose-6-phosphate transaminase (isomerizing), partial [Candidatus Dormibacteraeota bacterium]|nr:glutamine--fructose-6-phosphate transaminase (isomerizing) [Candidatus Dormibacteraeota bacterium]
GAYALVVFHAGEPQTLVAARLNAPLVLGLGPGETFVSSDITALLPYTKRVLLLGEGEVAEARRGEVVVRSLDGTAVEPRVITVDWDAEQAQKGGYPHFMLKEIHEQPQALRQTLAGRIDPISGLVDLPDLGVDEATLQAVTNVHIVACGTAYYAGLATALAVERLARVPARVTAASEFRYADPLVDARSLVVAVSQSGETADTIAAVREARRRGAPVLAVTNVVGSALNLEADGTLAMQAGPEIAVASTKCFLAQLVCGVLVALRLADARGALSVDRHRALAAALTEIPDLVARALELEPRIAEIAQRHAHLHGAMYIGRGPNVVTAFEGALKLKEVAYVHAEGYAAGELKHGPIALLDPNLPVVAVATRSATLAKTVSNVEEAHARQAPVIAVVTEGENPFEAGFVRDTLEVPGTDELLSPIVNVVPLQLLAYHVAVERGADVDQPRNLAKSVTVE